MSIMAGTFTALPMMELTFEVLVARMTTEIVPGNINPRDVWTTYGRHVPCDIAPINDQLFFLQSGSDNIATHILHFYANEDINPKDRVQFITTKRLAGPVGSWYEITSVLEPTETIAYLRAYAKISDVPGKG